MKIISWNVNGIRSVTRQGFWDWFYKEDADIVSLQEVKIAKQDLSFELSNPKGYYSYFNLAKKKGYSGVAIFSKKKPITMNYKLITDNSNNKAIEQFNNEGRFLKLEYKNFSLINIYIPHGGRDKSKLNYKLAVYDLLSNLLTNKLTKPTILCGDFNIAHQEIDLARPKFNTNNIMFTPEERIYFNKILDLGYIDSFRAIHKEGGNYTWWPYMHNARERNLGWRIDYIFVNDSLREILTDAFILKDVLGSDHCPIGVQIKNRKYF